MESREYTPNTPLVEVPVWWRVFPLSGRSALHCLVARRVSSFCYS